MRTNQQLPGFQYCATREGYFGIDTLRHHEGRWCLESANVAEGSKEQDFYCECPNQYGTGTVVEGMKREHIEMLLGGKINTNV